MIDRLLLPDRLHNTYDGLSFPGRVLATLLGLVLILSATVVFRILIVYDVHALIGQVAAVGLVVGIYAYASILVGLEAITLWNHYRD